MLRVPRLIKLLLRLCSLKWGMSGRGWPSYVELEPKIELKSYALSDKEEMTSEPFIIVDTGSCLCSKFGWCSSKTLRIQFACFQPWLELLMHNYSLPFTELWAVMNAVSIQLHCSGYGELCL